MRSYATISATGFTQTDHAGLVKLMWEWHETIDQFIASCKAKMINQSAANAERKRLGFNGNGQRRPTNGY